MLRLNRRLQSMQMHIFITTPWFILLILLLFWSVSGSAAIGVWMWACRANRRRAKHYLPVCANCGYPARGVSQLCCPECGADLREAGIVSARRPFNLLTRIALTALITLMWIIFLATTWQLVQMI